LNWVIEKSELLVAYYPSLPEIPIPTWAYRIILTSFAPSPIAKVMTEDSFYDYLLVYETVCLYELLSESVWLMF